MTRPTQRIPLLGIAGAVCLALLLSAVAAPAAAQTDPTNDEPNSSSEPLLVNDTDTPLKFTFDESAFEVDLYNQTFDYGGSFSGFDPAPAARQLDATEFTVDGVNGGSRNFGDAEAGGKYANGNSTGGVTTGGLWGFDVDNSGGTSSTNWAIGIQPTDQDLTSGALYFCYQNKTGTQVDDANVTFDLHEYNDQNGSVQVAVEANVNSSACDASQSTSGADMGGGPVQTAGTAASSPQWVKTDVEAYFDNLGLAQDAYFMVKIVVEDPGSGAPFDEIAVDDPTATFNPSTPIPVELASFEASRVDESAVMLRWTTASETGNAGFRVQHRGPKAQAWSALDFVRSKADGGTTTQATTYRFRAGDLPVGTHRFRLKQVDVDGTTQLHDPVAVEVGMQEALRVTGPSPNPVSDDAIVSVAVKEAAETTVRLYNALGQRVATVYQGRPPAGERTTASLDATGLPSGIYFLRAQSGSHTETRRVTVVR